MRVLIAFALAAVVATGAAHAQARKAGPGPVALTSEQAVTLTCAQAWMAAHRSYPEMLAIVTTLAKVSLVNRDLTLPNRRETGVDAGKGIGEDCKADPDALLFAVVDRHVRRVAESA